MNKEYVILVDNNDQQIGTMEKMEAHQKGLLHRAFSVFIFNSKGELLLQRRSLNKYHSAGLWTNTCCSHPRENEKIIDAANRRLVEEMGINTRLNYLLSFIYNEKLTNDLIENEFDHVLYGITDENPILNNNEVMEFKYISIDKLKNELISTPELFTIWFQICFTNVIETLNKNNISFESNSY